MLLEPDVKDIESYAKTKISFPHLRGRKTPAAEFQSYAEAVVPAEYRQGGTQGYSHGIDVGAIYGIVRLVIVYTTAESAAAEKVQDTGADVVPVGGELTSQAERLAHGRGKNNVSHIGETAHLIHSGFAPV